MEKEEQKVPVPSSLNAKQTKIAQAYATEQMKSDFTIADFCSRQSISTKTFYGDNYKGNPIFMKYVDALLHEAIPDDEMVAFRKMKRHLLKLAEKENPTTKEIQMFMDSFDYLREADKRQQMDRLGLTPNQTTSGSFGIDTTLTTEQRKKNLMDRLTKKN